MNFIEMENMISSYSEEMKDTQRKLFAMKMQNLNNDLLLEFLRGNN